GVRGARGDDARIGAHGGEATVGHRLQVGRGRGLGGRGHRRCRAGGGLGGRLEGARTDAGDRGEHGRQGGRGARVVGRGAGTADQRRRDGQAQGGLARVEADVPVRTVHGL